MAGQVLHRVRSRPVMAPLGRGLCAFGVLTVILAGVLALGGEPASAVALALPAIGVGLALVGLGAVFWSVGGLRQRLFETEQALAEAQARLDAAMVALTAARSDQKIEAPVFRSRPAGRRRLPR